MKHKCEEDIKKLQAENEKLRFVDSYVDMMAFQAVCPYTTNSFCLCLEELKAEYEKDMADMPEDERYEFDPEEECSLI